MNVSELRQLLSFSTGGYLGTYTLPDSSVIKALYVTPPQVPKTWKINGIELVIERTPSFNTSPMLSGRVFVQKNWRAIATSYDAEQTLDNVIDGIFRIFPTVNIVHVPQTDDDWERATFTMPDREIATMLIPSLDYPYSGGGFATPIIDPPISIPVSRLVFNEIPFGLIDGSNATFTARSNFIPDSLTCFLNGVKQTLDVDYVTTGGSIINLLFSPQPDDILTLNYTSL